MADRCDQCTYFVEDDEYGDYCSLSLDEDEMEKFLTGNTEQFNFCSFLYLIKKTSFLQGSFFVFIVIYKQIE